MTVSSLISKFFIIDPVGASQSVLIHGFISHFMWKLILLESLRPKPEVHKPEVALDCSSTFSHISQLRVNAVHYLRH